MYYTQQPLAPVTTRSIYAGILLGLGISLGKFLGDESFRLGKKIYRNLVDQPNN